MVILDPRSANFAPETLNLFDEVAVVAAELEKKRPFDQQVNSRLSTEFLPDRITASLNMEGISVSRRQTLLMMDAMTLAPIARNAMRPGCRAGCWSAASTGASPRASRCRRPLPARTRRSPLSAPASSMSLRIRRTVSACSSGPSESSGQKRN